MSVSVNHKKRKINFIAARFLLFIFIIGTGLPVYAEAKKQVMFPPTPTSTPVPCTSWDLAADFRVSPNQENPNRDSCNNPNVWQFMVGSGLTHDPLSYSLASYFTPNFNGAVDVNVWSGTSGLSWPFVGYNASSQTQLGSWLAHTINVHPKYNQLVIVAWKSPLTGYVSISGEVADADPACGGGIQWFIDRDAVNLASGSYTNGGAQTFSNGLNGTVLSMVAVNVNSMLYVMIDPNGNDLCDTTRVDLVINMVNPVTPTQTPTPLPKPSLTPTSCEFGTSPCTPTRTPTRTLTPTSTATSTSLCYGGNCNGLNPESMGCGVNAQTSLNFRDVYDVNNNLIGKIQNRYSTICLAQWELTRNMSNSPLWVEGSIRWGGNDYTPGIQPEDGKAKEGEIIYTPMYGDDAGFGPALNCGNLASSPVYPPDQPIILTSQYGLYNCFSATPSY